MTTEFRPGSPLDAATRDPVTALALLIEACERGEKNLRSYLDAGVAAIDYHAAHPGEIYGDPDGPIHECPAKAAGLADCPACEVPCDAAPKHRRWRANVYLGFGGVVVTVEPWTWRGIRARLRRLTDGS